MTEPMIYKAIADVMTDIGAVGKNQKNQQQGFMFRGIDAVMNAINPALIKNKVFIVPEILEQSREERQTARGGNLIYSICKVKYTFFTIDGSSISAIVIGEGMDSGDKATNKAMSIAFKYACFQVFCIPTEEMKDPDADIPDSSVRKEKQTKVSLKVSGADARKEEEPKERVETLQTILKEQGINASTVFNLYRVKDLSELSESQYANIMKNISKIKQKQEEGNE